MTPLSPTTASLPDTASKDMECRKICVERSIFAIVYCVGMQFFLLCVFLLFVNFDLLHPISWFAETFRILFSFYTWLCIMPLILAVIVHGIFQGKTFLAENRYYPTRFSLLYQTLTPKTVLLLVNCFVGLLTAWLYSKFLRDEYNVLFINSTNKKMILNEKYLFLLFNGVFTGIYFFFKHNLEKNSLIFPVIQQSRYNQIRSQIYSILYTSLMKSFAPTLYYIGCFYTIGALLRFNMATKNEDEILETFNLTSFYNIVSDVRLLIYVWILSSQILSNMNLMQILFTITLTEYKEFQVERSSFEQSSDVTLVEALSNEKLQVTQQLAAMDLFLLSDSFNAKRRSQIFALSVPGGHPYNWKILNDTCMKLIREYSIELAKSVAEDFVEAKKRPAVQQMPSDLAQQVLKTQYNESYGIRNMSSPPNLPIPTAQRDPEEVSDFLLQKLDSIKKSFIQLPGIFYFFGETKSAKTCHLLATKSQTMIWITQGISSLTTHSIKEDKYGVVQNDIPAIIKTILQLKMVLDKVGTNNLEMKKVDRNYIALKSAVKRSLYRVTTTFSDYFGDLIIDPQDMKVLQSFINYRES